MSQSTFAPVPRAIPKPIPRNSFHFDVPAPRPHHIEQFQALYHRERGVILSEREAADKLTALLVLVRYRQYEEEWNRFLQSSQGGTAPDRSPEPNGSPNPSRLPS